MSRGLVPGFIYWVGEVAGVDDLFWAERDVDGVLYIDISDYADEFGVSVFESVFFGHEANGFDDGIEGGFVWLGDVHADLDESLGGEGEAEGADANESGVFLLAKLADFLRDSLDGDDVF